MFNIFLESIKRCTAQVPSVRIAAMSITSSPYTFLGVDRDGNPSFLSPGGEIRKYSPGLKQSQFFQDRKSSILGQAAPSILPFHFHAFSG
jgi:hypothetical protein